MVFHQAVLKQEVEEYLNPKPGKVYLDATLGGGEHSQAIIENGGLVLGIDWDPAAREAARKRLAACPASFSPQKEAIAKQESFANKPYKITAGNFANLSQITQKEGIKSFAGILFDLGTSQHHFKEGERGFSFESEELDMRMNPALKVTAADLVAALSENELYQIFTKFAQEKRARTIARAIVRARQVKPIQSGKRLANVVSQAVGGRHGRIHPATKVFQALRIAVNDELNNLKKALPQAVKLLESNARLLVISFHEGEDRIVKNYFKGENEKKIAVITKKPISANAAEIKQNPSARSAKLRVAQKI